jgi:hypothetical protein
MLFATSFINSDEKKMKSIIFQILLLFFVIRSIYYISTQNTIAFGDAYWDYAVVKAFSQQNSIFLIHSTVFPIEAGGISQLTWYSGWPILHSLGLSFCKITGIDPFYLNLIVSPVLGFVTIIVTFLLVESLRKELGLSSKVTYIALLIYAVTPENVFWQMQFTRQSLALTLFALFIYLIYTTFSQRPDRRYGAVLLALALLLIMAHHFTSFSAILFIGLFSTIVILGKYLSGINALGNLFQRSHGKSYLALTLAMSAFLLLWWDNVGIAVWPTVQSRIIHFIESLTNTQLNFWPTAAYPSALRPAWVIFLLRIRDIILYLPAFVGFFLLYRRKTKTPGKFFVIYFALAFSLIFLVNNFIFAIEPRRAIMYAMPVVSLLSSIFYNKIQLLFKAGGNAIIFLVIVILVFSSFIGLWAHDYAPMHLYNPNTSSIDVGEVTPYYTRLKPFFEEKVPIEQVQTIWVDAIDQLVYILNLSSYDKIRMLPSSNIEQIQFGRNDIICSTRDLSLYSYYSYIWQSVKGVEEARNLQDQLRQYLSCNDSRVYDDGRNTLWIPCR